jgi:hypothetical protein
VKCELANFYQGSELLFIGKLQGSPADRRPSLGGPSGGGGQVGHVTEPELETLRATWLAGGPLEPSGGPSEVRIIDILLLLRR